jgi:hypothetical protein
MHGTQLDVGLLQYFLNPIVIGTVMSDSNDKSAPKYYVFQANKAAKNVEKLYKFHNETPLSRKRCCLSHFRATSEKGCRPHPCRGVAWLYM